MTFDECLDVLLAALGGLGGTIGGSIIHLKSTPNDLAIGVFTDLVTTLVRSATVEAGARVEAITAVGQFMSTWKIFGDGLGYEKQDLQTLVEVLRPLRGKV